MSPNGATLARAFFADEALLHASVTRERLAARKVG